AYEMAARILGNFTRGVAAVSRALERTLRRWVRAAPVAFVPNGLPPCVPASDAERAAARARFDVAEQAYCIAVIGRLAAEKGHRVLLEAVRQVRAAVREKVEQSGLERARGYGVAAMAGAYASLYGRALAGSRSSQ